jgi:hypothetical protein
MPEFYTTSKVIIIRINEGRQLVFRMKNTHQNNEKGKLVSYP